MSIYLDHIFIITKPAAAEAQRLIDLGFVEGNANVHPGQGTSNRRFFLEGFTIELLYISDEEEAENGAGKDLGILSRSRDANACPFGLVVRVSEDESTPTFPSWQYYPDYFHGKMSFYVGNNSTVVEEPLCICMPPLLPKSARTPAEYANPGWELTALKLDTPTVKPSETLTCFAAMDKVSLDWSKNHKMTMQFNNGRNGRTEDLAPDLPLILNW